MTITPTARFADISAIMDGIGHRMGLILESEVRDLAGVFNSDAAYAVKTRENTQGIVSKGDWGYYAKQIVGITGQFLKAWVRWNVEGTHYDYYLNASAGEVFEHATPYVGTVY